MNSFGLYDTLVVRRLLEPQHLPALLERVLAWPGFAALRRQAEALAIKRHAPRRPALAEVYAELAALDGSGASRHAAARAEELRLEAALLAPVPANLRRLQSGDLVVAETPLASDTLREALRRYGLRTLPALKLSGETGLGLRDVPLWDGLAAAEGPPLWHVGSGVDCEEPRRRGWRIYHFDAGQPSPWEAAWMRHGQPEPSGGRNGGAPADPAEATLVAAAVAGCARAARLAHFDPQEPAEEALLCDLAGSVLAPALVAFADAWLDRAVALGAKRPLVASGVDGGGQLLHRVAVQRARQRRLGVEPVYAYTGAPMLEPADARRWCSALGLDGRTPVLLAERGWRGEGQAWLREALVQAGVTVEPTAWVFGSSLAASDPVATGGEAWAFGPGCDGRFQGLASQRAMLAALLAADEGPLRGFQPKGKALVPRLGDAPAAASLKAIRLQQGAVLAFVHEWAAFEAATGAALRIPRAAALAVLQRFLQHPRREDAQVFAAREAADDDAGAPRPLVARLSAGAGLAQREAWGAWPEGSLALLGAAPLAPLMRLVRRLRG